MKGIDPSLAEPLNPEENEVHNDAEEEKETVEPRHTAEDEKLGGHPPLSTIFRLSFGPLLSQVTNALFGIITTIWVSKAIGVDGVSAVSTMNAFDGIGRAFGFFLAVAASTQISSLFGRGLSQEAGQLIADLLRMCLVCGAIVPACMLPILKPCARWFGAEEKIVEMGFQYMLPLCACTTTTCMYVATGGFLQGEGRTFLFGMLNISNLCLNMLILDPLFLFPLKMGIVGASLATVISEIIPTVIVLACFYAHKFGVKPTCHQLLTKFSPHSIPSLKVGFSQLISQLSVCIPSVLVRKYVGLTTEKEVDFTNAMAGFNASIRFNNLSMSIFFAITQALSPAASYAYAAKRYRRFLWLCFHSLWINFAWGCLTTIITWAAPREISKIFGNGEGYLYYAERMTRIINSLAPISGFRMNFQSFCQAMQLGGRASILSFLNNFVSITLFTILLYYTDKHDGSRIIWCYPLSYVASVVFSVILLWSPLKKTFKLAKEEGETLNELNEIHDTKEKIKDDPIKLAQMEIVDNVNQDQQFDNKENEEDAEDDPKEV